MRYFIQFEERLTNTENAIQSKQAGQNHVETVIPPIQTNTVVSQDFIAVQKTEDKGAELPIEHQSDIVPAASPEPSIVSIDTTQISHITGTKPIKKKTSHSKQRKFKLRMLNMKQKKFTEEKKEEVPQSFWSQLFNFFIVFTNEIGLLGISNKWYVQPPQQYR